MYRTRDQSHYENNPTRPQRNPRKHPCRFDFSRPKDRLSILGIGIPHLKERAKETQNDSSPFNGFDLTSQKDTPRTVSD